MSRRRRLPFAGCPGRRYGSHVRFQRRGPRVVLRREKALERWAGIAVLIAALVWAYDLPAVTDDTPLRINLYAEDTVTRSLEPITISQADPLFITDFLNIGLWGVSADARHVALVTPTRMLPDAAPGVPNVY